MNHQNYIGKTLQELVNDMPSFAVGFHAVYTSSGILSNLRDVLNNQELLDSQIKEIKTWSDYDFWIILAS